MSIFPQIRYLTAYPHLHPFMFVIAVKIKFKFWKRPVKYQPCVSLLILDC